MTVCFNDLPIKYRIGVSIPTDSDRRNLMVDIRAFGKYFFFIFYLLFSNRLTRKRIWSTVWTSKKKKKIKIEIAKKPRREIEWNSDKLVVVEDTRWLAQNFFWITPGGGVVVTTKTMYRRQNTQRYTTIFFVYRTRCLFYP